MYAVEKIYQADGIVKMKNLYTLTIWFRFGAGGLNDCVIFSFFVVAVT